MYMSRGNNRARASGAVGSHGRQDPVPDPRVFAWGREGFLAIFCFLFLSVFLLKTLKTKSRKSAPSLLGEMRLIHGVSCKSPSDLVYETLC